MTAERNPLDIQTVPTRSATMAYTSALPAKNATIADQRHDLVAHQIKPCRSAQFNNDGVRWVVGIEVGGKVHEAARQLKL